MNIVLKTLVIVLTWSLLTNCQADCKKSTAQFEKMTQQFIEIVNAQDESVLLRVKVADDDQERAAGYQHICPEVIDKTAILFKFEEELSPSFHMHNVYAGLDIAFIDANGVIRDIQLMKSYFSTGVEKLYPSKAIVKYALEVPQGYFKKHNIISGESRIKIQ